MSRPEQQDADGLEVVRSEEELHLGTRLQDVGRVFVRKLVGERHDSQEVERQVEQARVDTQPAEPGDTGDVLTLPDGSLSIPVFEEKVFIEKRLVVKERLIVSKFSMAHREQVETDVRVEHVEVVAEAAVGDRLHPDADAADLVRSPVAPSSTGEMRR